MPFLVVLAIAWLVGVPLACLIAAFNTSRRAERQDEELARLRTRLSRLEIQSTQWQAQAVPTPAAPQAAAPTPAKPAPEPTPLAPTTRGAPTVPPSVAQAASSQPRVPATEPAPTTVPPRPGPTPERPLLPTAPTPAPAWSTVVGKLPVKVDWEQFMGVKLFAWIGGFALFLAVAFFVKYSFENNLIPPELRVVLGFLAGVGLVVGGVVLKRKAYAATSQTLCATGVVILYAVSFACHAYYHFTGAAATFALMVLVTVTAFLLAERLNALVVAVLGLVGGFLTPPLLSTGVDNPLGLFGYVAILDAGLIALALKRRWNFLVGLGVLGTLFMELGWASEFFTVGKVLVALAIFATFNLLFVVAFILRERREPGNPWFSGAAVALPFVTFAFALGLLRFPELGARPGVLFSFLLAADLPVLALVLLRHRLHAAHLIAGGAAFIVLMSWTTGYLKTESLNWALGGYLLFAFLHAAFPVMLQRLRPGLSPIWWGHLFPPAALILVMLPLFGSADLSWAFWPAVLVIDVIAIGLALLTGAVLGVLAVLVLTLLLTGIWIVHTPAELAGMPSLLLVVGGFAVFFFLVGLFAGEKMLARLEASAGGGTATAPGGFSSFTLTGDRAESLAQIPALASILPFLLLILTVLRLPLEDPSPVYGLALLLVGLMLGLGRYLKLPVLAPVGLGCVLALEYAWHAQHFTATAAAIPLLWNLGFTAVFVAYPFLFRRAFARPVLPWATAALSGPLHFYLVHQVIKQAYPNAVMGMLPTVFAVPMILALAFVARSWAKEAPNRTALLAWFGGSALFFITLIFPIQFDRQWITIGWALEGMALLWLFHRVPHPGLRGLGVALLVTAFVRLALNPAVLEYHPRSDLRLWNWFLYGYGVVTVCLLTGARLLAPPRHRLAGVPLPPILYTLGTVLAFLLLNIEIADYFSEGATLTFQFSGNLARDMTYSIAWALFALVLLAVGVWKHQRAVRYASLALLGATVLKLFFHDLGSLSALYRIGAFLGVAIISILASALYQRFFAGVALRAEAAEPADPDGKGRG